MRTRRSRSNQDRLFKELFRPTQPTQPTQRKCGLCKHYARRGCAQSNCAKVGYQVDYDWSERSCWESA